LCAFRQAPSAGGGPRKGRASGAGSPASDSQKPRSTSTRRSGGLPAMIAAVIAPAETPTTRSGSIPASAIAA
jgi:hypothetical protein